MTPSELALERFDKKHPPHANPARRGDPYETEAMPSPTTDHVRVQCGCGHMERFTYAALGLPQTDRRYRTAPG